MSAADVQHLRGEIDADVCASQLADTVDGYAEAANQSQDQGVAATEKSCRPTTDPT